MVQGFKLSHGVAPSPSCSQQLIGLILKIFRRLYYEVCEDTLENEFPNFWNAIL